MSDMFSDKQYQTLDWISQAVEPWDWDLIAAFAQFPERVEITPNIVEALFGDSHSMGSVYISQVLLTVADAINSDLKSLKGTNDFAKEAVSRLFKLKIEDDTEIDGTTLVFTKPIYLVKTQQQLDDKFCLELLAASAGDTLTYIDFRDSTVTKRANEIMDLVNSSKLSRGYRHKRYQLCEQIRAAIRAAIVEDKWRIRSIDLGLKTVQWINDYIREGSLASMANFAKLKVMTHAGKAIYSIQEVE